MFDVADRVEIGDRLRTANRRIFTWRAPALWLAVAILIDVLQVPHGSGVMHAILMAGWILALVSTAAADVLTRAEGESPTRVVWRRWRGWLVILGAVAVLMVAATVWS